MDLDLNLNSLTQINSETIASLKELNTPENNFLQQITGVFLKQYGENIKVFAVDASSIQWAQAAKVLHQIKSSAGNMGALNFSALCGHLEDMALEGKAKEATELLPLFLAAYKSVGEQLKALS